MVSFYTPPNHQDIRKLEVFSYFQGHIGRGQLHDIGLNPSVEWKEIFELGRDLIKDTHREIAS